jgi:CRISPR system Cascade subunit CasB
MSQPGGRERGFIDYLQGFIDREDRAPLAMLRRGRGKSPGETAEMHRYVLPFLRDDAGKGEEEAYYRVASLFAWHQRDWHRERGQAGGRATNLGASFAWLVRETGSESIEARFVALLNCRSDELSDHLRHGVGLLRAHEIPIDWAQLLRDLQGWEREDRRVQRAWARAYWGAPGPAETANAPTSEKPAADGAAARESEA